MSTLDINTFTYYATIFIAVVLPIFSMLKILHSTDIVSSLNDLSKKLNKGCKYRYKCGTDDVCRLIKDLQKTFNPKKQFRVAIGILLLSAFTALLTYPQNYMPLPYIFYLIRGFIIGVQVITCLQVVSFNNQLSNIAPNENIVTE